MGLVGCYIGGLLLWEGILRGALGLLLLCSQESSLA